MAALHIDATPYAVARSYTTLLDTTAVDLGEKVIDLGRGWEQVVDVKRRLRSRQYSDQLRVALV